jgi:hypothetical protein
MELGRCRTLAGLVAFVTAALFVLGCANVLGFSDLSGSPDAGSSTDPSDPGDAGTDRQGPGTHPPSSAGDASTCDAGSPAMACPASTVDPATLPSLAPPAPPQKGACSEAEVTALIKIWTSASVDDLKNAVSPSCAACAFTPASASKWGPIPIAPDACGIDQIFTISSGGCMMTMTGNSACAQASQALDDCEEHACAGCSLSGWSQCPPIADHAACAAEYDAWNTGPACSSVPTAVGQKATAACYPTNVLAFVGPLRVACVAVPP